MEVKLIVATGKQTGKELVVKGPTFLIGRDEQCQLRPQSSLVSRKHCVILVEETSVAVEDCGSTNHTFVNEEQLHQRRELRSGDRIRVGTLGLDVRFDAGVQEQPKAHRVHQTAARAVGSAAAGDDDEIDISNWLSDDNAKPGAPRSRNAPAAGTDTLSGTSLVDTTAIPAPAPAPSSSPPKKEKEEGKKKAVPAKTTGKLQRSAKPPAESSGAAADDALRQFFHRKK
jgi:predicted component of type VI protein secretion system